MKEFKLDDLEFENGQLVKVRHQRPEYMDGNRLIRLVRFLGAELHRLRQPPAPVHVTDEMVEAALDEAGSQWGMHNTPKNKRKLMRAAIAAALQAGVPSGWKLVPEDKLMRLLDWMAREQDDLTCSLLCDKTHETQGCVGECALEAGKRFLREFKEMFTPTPPAVKGDTQ